MLLWFSVTPLGTGSASVADEVARALDAVDDVAAETGLTVTTEASGTLLEGDWDACHRAVRAAVDAVLAVAPRVSVVTKLDVRTDRPDRTGADKLASLERARDRARDAGADDGREG